MRLTKRNLRKAIIIIIIALVFIVGLYLLVSKIQFFVGTRFYVKFNHIGSLAVGAMVRTSGVRIGSVSKLEISEIDRKTVIAEISLYPGRKVLKGSRYIIMSGSLLGDQYVEVIPSDSEEFVQDNETFQGDPIKNLDSFLLSSDTIIQDFTTSMSILADLLENNKDNIDSTIENIKESSDSIKKYLVTENGDTPSMLARFDRVLDGLEKITASLSSKDSIITVLSEKDSSEDIRKTIKNLKDISESLNKITKDLESIMGDIVPEDERTK